MIWGNNKGMLVCVCVGGGGEGAGADGGGIHDSEVF